MTMRCSAAAEPLTLTKLLFVHDVRVAVAHLRQEEGEPSAGDTAPEEDCRRSARQHHGDPDTGRAQEVCGPEKEERDALQRTAGVPIFFESELNASAEMIAPALPHAADIPCAEARKRVGKTSAG